MWLLPVQQTAVSIVSLLTARVRIITKQPILSDQISINHNHSAITQRQKSILDFSMKLCRTPEQINEEDYNHLYKQGLDDEDIWDISSVCAFFGLSNRMAIISAMQPNPEFIRWVDKPKGSVT